MIIGHDCYGNLWQQTLTAGSSGPQPSFSFNAANNQTAGYTYDAAGNMTNDGSHSYTYDAEGNILQVDAGSTATHIYDGSYDITNPQSFNRYAYVLNNPLSFTDPLGLECAIDGSGCSLGCNGDPLCGQPGIGGGGGGGGAGGTIGNDPFLGGSCCGALGGNDWNLQYGNNSWYVALLNGSSELPSEGISIYVGCVGPSIFDFKCMPDEVSIGYFGAGNLPYTNGLSIFAGGNFGNSSSQVPHWAIAGSVALPIAPGIIWQIPFAQVPSTGTLCLGLGGGFGSPGFNGGAVYSSANIEDVLSGPSVSVSGQAGLWGGQSIHNMSGLAIGNSIGTPGFSVAVS